MRRGRKAQRSRSVGYAVPGTFVEAAVERVLEAAKREGVVTEYDTGRGALVWFNGPPGKTMRELRSKIEGMRR